MADGIDLDAANFEGHANRECGEHRTVGPHRAWCYDCTEWCYPDDGCNGCKLPALVAEVERLRLKVEMLQNGFQCVSSCSCETHCPRHEGQTECDPPCCHPAAVRQRDAALARIRAVEALFDQWEALSVNPEAFYPEAGAWASGVEGGYARIEERG